MSFTYQNATLNTSAKPTFWWQDTTTTKIGDYTWQPHVVGNIQDISSISLDTLSKEWQESINKVLGINKEDEKYMYKNYYNIIIISTKGKVLLDCKEIATNEEDAKFQADVHRVIKVNQLELSDVTILVNNLGKVKLDKEGDK